MKVSVVIPCYNVAAFVEDAVASALDQTYPIGQIICVDDGSTDATLQVLQGLKHAYPEQLMVHSGPNRGGNHARNCGLSLVRSNYVQFLDADDVLDPDKIAHQAQLVEKTSTRVDIVAGAYRKGPSRDESVVRKPGRHHDLVNLAGSDLGRTSSNLWRAQSVVDAGGWNEKVYSSQEYELMFRMIQRDAMILYDRAPKTWLRKRPTSITGSDNVSVPEGIVLLRIEILRYAKNINTKEDDIYKIEKSLFYWIKHLRKLSLYRSIKLFNKSDINNYIPDRKVYGIAYTTLYRLFGFRLVEYIRECIILVRKKVSL